MELTHPQRLHCRKSSRCYTWKASLAQGSAMEVKEVKAVASLEFMHLLMEYCQENTPGTTENGLGVVKQLPHRYLGSTTFTINA